MASETFELSLLKTKTHLSAPQLLTPVDGNSLLTPISGARSYQSHRNGFDYPSGQTTIVYPQYPQVTQDNDSDYTQDNDPNWKRDLNVFDVAALILNKMIGAGFFTLNGIVLDLTRSKTITIALWAFGGVYSAMNFAVYLEYAYGLPFNGGDLIYLDRVFPRPRLLCITLYSSFFIGFATTAGNCYAFSRLVISAAAETNDRPNGMLLRLVAIVVLTFVCLLLYFSKAAGRAVNRLLMLYKTCLFIAVFIAGMLQLGPETMDDWHSADTPGTSSGVRQLAAFIYIIYAYEGWENANYVGGEIKNVAKGTLRNGGFIAIATTTVLYVIGSAGYFAACTNKAIIDSAPNEADLGMAGQFAMVAFGDTSALKVGIAISALGNLVAVIFSNSMVKQSIALQNIFPFSGFLKREDADFRTPRGAIFLQWLTTIPFIVTATYNSDGYAFIVGIYSYLHIFVVVAADFGMLVLSIRKMPSSKKSGPKEMWEWYEYSFLKKSYIRWPLIVVSLGINIVVLVISANDKTPDHGGTPRWIWPVIGGGTVGFGLLYWSLLWSLQRDRFLSRALGIKAQLDDLDEVVEVDFTSYNRGARADGTHYRMKWKIERGGLGYRLREHWRTVRRLCVYVLT